MANLPPQTHIADADCLDCGKEVKVKTNKNGKAYYYCNHVNVASGNLCGAHHRWGKDPSEQMVRDYLAARKDHNTSERQSNVADQDTHPDLSKHPEPEVGADSGANHIADRNRDTGGTGGWGLFD